MQQWVLFHHPPCRIHPYLFGWVGLWTGAFSVWAVVWRLISGRFLYPFLDWTKPWAPLAYIGVLHATMPVASECIDEC